ncbi:MAG: EamA family transporter [Bryobacteraceae bacterium]|jgi:drug/metabolite transporter (DMT)-like permease
MLEGHSNYRAWIALGAVCLFWGTTYLGIRMALECFPPATLLSIRYTLSGAILLIAARASRARIPSGRELLFTALYGVVVLVIGNGALVFAEEWVPSGMASVFITTSPFWMTGVEAALPGGERLHLPAIIGMLVGLAGTVVLVSRDAFGQGAHGGLLSGFLLLQLGCCGWAVGSVLQRRYVTAAHPVVSGAVQQLATGLVAAVPAFFISPHVPHFTVRGVMALGWLVVFGSIVGYSAFIYVMDKLPVSVVSIYNYVNPVVAVILGWLFYRERFGAREALGMAIIFVGVAVVKRFSSTTRSRPVLVGTPASE